MMNTYESQETIKLVVPWLVAKDEWSMVGSGDSDRE